MSDDVILSRAEAKNLADFLRRRGIGEHHSLLKRLDPPQPSLLDPPQPSLRDEVASVLLDNGWTCEYHEPDAYCGECRRLYAVTADAVLAVARKHYRERAEGLISWDSNGNPVIDRRDVLALLGGES